MDEREFELINILGKQLGSNQRDLSRQMELSLGMVNMLIRRLISKGYIRMDRLNKRNVRYILTPKGISEKMRKSVKYTLNTINSIGLIKDNLRELLVDLYDKGHRKFYNYSQADLTLLIDKAFHEARLEDAAMQHLDTFPGEELDGFLLTGYENLDVGDYPRDKQLDLLTEIAKTDLANL